MPSATVMAPLRLPCWFTATAMSFQMRTHGTTPPPAPGTLRTLAPVARRRLMSIPTPPAFWLINAASVQPWAMLRRLSPIARMKQLDNCPPGWRRFINRGVARETCRWEMAS